MKIYITSQFTKDLTSITAEELESFGICSLKYAKLPIKLEKFKFYLNEDGYAVISFDTKNHKYLDIDYNTSTNLRYDSDFEEFPFHPRGFSIRTHEKYRHETNLTMLPVSRLMLWLEPDNEEEAEIIDGEVCILPSRGHYEIVIVPYSKFKPRENTSDNILEDFDVDVLYTKDIFDDN
jgi:hypothetical protein